MNLFDLSAKITLDKSGYESGIEEAKGGIGGLSAWAIAKGALIADGLKAGARALADFGGKVVGNFANYEQLVGGVDTLFKGSSGKVQQYAAEAFRTTGMSANEYMETVTGFSASLLQSLGGDTDKAADYANMALTDMSDNANKMGTNIEMIKNAYGGFAKQNFTMLDNLKLGYGGTKEEMERLLADAGKLSGQQFDISSYSDIVDAVHVIQTEMGITGTTSAEAADTISGSAASSKAAWENFTVSLATGEGIEENLNVLIGSVTTSVSNIVPIVGTVFTSIATTITTHFPEIVAKGKELLSKLAEGIIQGVPKLVEKLPEIITAFVNWVTGVLPEVLKSGVDFLSRFAVGIIQTIPKLVAKLPEIIKAFVRFIVENLPVILEQGVQLLWALIEGIIDTIPELLKELPQVITSIVETLKEGWEDLVEAGKYLLEGLWTGIGDKVEWLKGKVHDVVDTIKGWFTSEEGFDIHSPSKWFERIGQYMMSGLAIGLGNSSGEVMESVSDVVGEIKSRFDNLKNVFSTRMNISELNYKLWETSDGIFAGEVEKFRKKIEFLSDQHREQEGVVDGATKAYEAAEQQYGKNSEKALEFLEVLLQEKVALQELEEQMFNTRKEMEQFQLDEYNKTLDADVVSFNQSAYGKASAGVITAVTNRDYNAMENKEVEIVLKSDDGTTFGRWMVPYIRSEDKSNPEVVSDK